MKVTVKFFASLAEDLGFSEREIEVADQATVEEVWRSCCPARELPPHVLAAVNLEYAGREGRVRDGDEVAFFPPVTGGANSPTIEVLSEPFLPWEVVADREREQRGAGYPVGAAAVFVGTMRDRNEGDVVTEMQLDHYPAMTRKHLEGIVESATERWDLLDVLVRHRVGILRPGDPIVLVAVWAGHRAHAFEACRFIMEDLKSRAPFWKKESTASGERWVAGNTPGYVAETPEEG